MDDAIKPDLLEYINSAEQLKTSVEETLKKIKLKKTIYSRNKPILVVDFYHNIRGEIISIKEIDEAVEEGCSIFKIMLFKSDKLDDHIPEIVRKLRENIKNLKGWTIVFTEPENYSHIEEFNKFIPEEKEDIEVITI